MPSTQKSGDLVLVIRFTRAVLLALYALFTLAITVAMMWKEAAVPSLFDFWFGQWTDTQLTALSATASIGLFGALRMTQKSEALYRQRSSNR